MIARLSVLCVTVALLLSAGCDLSEPLTPVTAIQSPLFRPYADPAVWAQTSEAAKRELWRRYEGEFQTLRSAKDFPGLLRLAREAQHLYPQERQAWLDLSTALLIMGDFGQTITAARGALAEERKEEFHPDSDHTMRCEAMENISSAQIELAQLDEALKTLDQALSTCEGHARTLLLRGEVLHRLGRDTEAVASYERALALNPQPPEIVSSDYILYSNALRDLGDVAGAERAIRRGIAQLRHDFGLHYQLALLDQQQGKLDEAFYEHQHEILLRPDSPYRDRVLAALRGLAQAAAGQSQGPVQDTLRQLFQAQNLAGAGQREGAIEIWESLLGQRPEGDKSIYLPLMIAQGHRDLGHLEEAAQWYRRVLERDPGFIPARVDLAEVLDELGRHDEALRELLEAQRQNPIFWRLRTHFEQHPERPQELLRLQQSLASGEAALPQ
jgi:tetratricopeptide (TPR) repeat protein